MLKTVFMGTPEFAIDSLKYIYENTELLAIYTKEDKLNSRGNKIIYSPVKDFAIKNNVKCIQPKSLSNEEVYNELKELNPDLIVVAAYGKIIPKKVIVIPKYGIINVHSSLLPKYRGASPIHNALINGDTKTGITIMMIDEGLDTGDILEKIELDILEEDNLETLTNKLAKISIIPLEKVLKKIETNTLTRIKQDDSMATLVKPIKKEDTKINWNNTKEDIYNLVRGLYDKPCSYTILNNERLKVYEVIKSDEKFDGKIGTVVAKSKKGPIIKVTNGSIILSKIQLQGKKIQQGIDLINGRKIELGDDLNA